MKSKVKVIFLFWTNGLSTSHHILIVHCASSKDSFSADHSSSLHSGAFTWLRFSASLKVLVWARRCKVAKFIYRHHVADVSVFNFPMRPIFVKVPSKFFSVTNQRFWYKWIPEYLCKKTFNAMLVIPYLFNISKSKHAIVLVIEIFIVVLGSFQIMFDRFCPWREGGVVTPQIRQKFFVKNIVHKGGKGSTPLPPSLSKKIPQKIGILGPEALFLVPFNVM